VVCRPHYLTDLSLAVPAQSVGVELGGGVNGALLDEDYAPLFQFDVSAAFFAPHPNPMPCNNNNDISLNVTSVCCLMRPARLSSSSM
jgi:hypothetical protein